MTRECLSCGTKINTWDHRSKQYCDDKCKDMYHRASRKIERKKARYYAIIGELLEMRDNANSNHLRDKLNAVISELGAEPNPKILS